MAYETMLTAHMAFTPVGGYQFVASIFSDESLGEVIRHHVLLKCGGGETIEEYDES